MSKVETMYSLEVGVVFSDDANLDLGGLEVDGEHLAEARDCELHGVVRGQIGALFELQIKKTPFTCIQNVRVRANICIKVFQTKQENRKINKVKSGTN